jgi:hypothetical protein
MVKDMEERIVNRFSRGDFRKEDSGYTFGPAIPRRIGSLLFTPAFLAA